MKVTVKSVTLIVDYGDGKIAEVEMSPDGKEHLSVKPLFHPAGLVFYLDPIPIKGS